MTGPGRGNIQQDGIQMSSNTMTDDEMREALSIENPAPPDPPEPAKEPAEPAPPAEPPVGPAAKVVETPKPKSKSRDANDAIAKATYEREEEKRQAAAAKEEARLAREEAAAVRRELEQMRRGRTEPDPKREPVDTDPEPQFEQFAEHGALQYEKWIQAQARWGARQEYKEQRQREIQAQREEARDRSLHEQHQKLAGSVRELMADPQIASAMQTVMIPGDPTHPVTAAIMQADDQKALIRHFAQHPEELAGVLALPNQLAQYRAMTRIEARLEYDSQQAAPPAPSGSGQPRPTSKAQPPINPVVGSHVAPDSGPPSDDASYEAHEAYWNKVEREARGRR